MLRGTYLIIMIKLYIFMVHLTTKSLLFKKNTSSLILKRFAGIMQIFCLQLDLSANFSNNPDRYFNTSHKKMLC